MAFTPIDIPIQEILETDFVVDMRIIENSNNLLLKDNLEDLINNLEIDVNTLSIGTDTPISYIKTDSVIMEDTGFILQTGTPTQIIGSLTKNGSDQSVLNVDILTVDSNLQTDSFSANAVSVIDSLSVTGDTTLDSRFTTNSSVIESKESITAVLTNVLNVATTTITLTSASKQNIFLTLDAGTGVDPVWVGAALVGGLTDINVIIDFDATNPPAQNMEFTIYLVNIKEEGQLPSTTIIPDINSYAFPGPGLSFTISAGTNQNTASNIELHTGSTSLTIPATSMLEFNSLASMLYIIDFNLNDRLMIKSAVNMTIA
jgi:hypothetical protein